MSENIKTKTLKIDGMTCASCENRIRTALMSTLGVINAKVSYTFASAIITYDSSIISMDKIIKKIEQLDYRIVHGGDSVKIPDNKNLPKAGKKTNIAKVLGTGIIIFALYMIVKQIGGSGIFNAFPQAEQGMGYGMLFIIGIFTSLHCVAMCGGINISQCVSPKSELNTQSKTQSQFQSQPRTDKIATLKPSILYNAGRVISYTVIGGIVGGLGSVVSFSGTAKGIVQIAAGVFMVIMGLNMLNIFPWLRRFNLRMPKIFSKRINEQKSGRSPLYVGLLNGLMPCGPLQAMQLYALSTGDPLKGALSMFLFSLGTVPLMFGLGALSTLLKKKFKSRMMTASAALVVVLGIFMFSSGMSLSGINLPSIKSGGIKSETNDKSKYINAAVITDGVQLITTKITARSYEPITVQKGIPVKWTIQADSGDINGCNNAIVIPEYNKELQFSAGDNVIEFTPDESGTFGYSCWMGMIRSKITVVDSLGGTSANSSASASASGNANSNASASGNANATTTGSRADTGTVAGVNAESGAGSDITDNTGLPACCQ
ncbi:MAG: urease accessory protein UreH domain-containing protein [Saccharofermentanales bacterium]